MRILLIDALDKAETGPWASQRWDRIVDLGMGGSGTYERWGRQFHCPVSALESWRDGFADFRRIRELLGVGCGRLIDEHGLDWWEIMSILLHAEMETLILLQRFVSTLGSDDRVYVSRAGLPASFLQVLLPTRSQAFPSRREAKKTGLGHYLRISQKLSTPQMIDVFWDKYDSGYQFRGRLARRRSPSARPVTLLPTAYVNVSRTCVAYANTFPDEQFLLVSTRRSGWVPHAPRNVATAWLSSYAAVGGREAENEDMEERWHFLAQELRSAAEFEVLHRMGRLNGFPRRFRHGFEVRDAWRNVLDFEPAQAVLCADDSNPYTRIPLLLGQARGLVNIACHHGALDGRYVFKRRHADVIWAKGKMEEDYLVRACGVPQERVEIGAPALPAESQGIRLTKRRSFASNILFFSEASEVSGGRPEEFYRDVLPPLADLALVTGRKVIVKLHPAENAGERSAILARILSREQNAATRIVSGPLTKSLLDEAWFGITILSTVATECAIQGIPCFLCRWLEFWPYGYVEQFVRFGVGIALDDPGGIRHIPEDLQRYAPVAEARDNCYQSVSPGRLKELLSSSRREFAPAG